MLFRKSGFSRLFVKNMQKTIIFIGIAIIVIGLFWPWLIKLPLGRLPGDIIIERPGFKFYFPVTTMVVVSIFLTILAWFFRK